MEDVKIAAINVTLVDVVGGKRTERKLQGKELQEWISKHITTEEVNDDNTNN